MPPLSVAVPEMVTIAPAARLEADAGEVIVERGAVVSPLAVAGINPL